LQALLIIMATGKYMGMDAHHPEFRAMFTREHLLESDWYRERLEIKQQRDIALWQRHVETLQHFLDDADYADEAERLGIYGRLDMAVKKLEAVEHPDYLKGLIGTLGADPLQPVRASIEENVIAWSKARLAREDDQDGIDEEKEAVSMRAYKAQSFIQRVKSRFKRVRLN
jgi:hypothetical protein